jgi:hypothetical protein
MLHYFKPAACKTYKCETQYSYEHYNTATWSGNVKCKVWLLKIVTHLSIQRSLHHWWQAPYMVHFSPPHTYHWSYKPNPHTTTFLAPLQHFWIQVKDSIISNLEEKLTAQTQEVTNWTEGSCHHADEVCLHTVNMTFSLVLADAQICGPDNKGHH